jgi:hypothetical protein
MWQRVKWIQATQKPWISARRDTTSQEGCRTGRAEEPQTFWRFEVSIGEIGMRIIIGEKFSRCRRPHILQGVDALGSQNHLAASDDSSETSILATLSRVSLLVLVRVRALIRPSLRTKD